MLRPVLTVGAVLAVGFFTAHFGLATLGKPLPAHPFWSEPVAPRVIAHRGGRGLWPENTLFAFRHALALGVDVLEMDVRRSVDGTLVVLHDETVERTTDGSGPVSTLTVSDLKRLDAGHRWTRDRGRTYPYRGQGLAVPTLVEVFQAFPGARLNLEIKVADPDIARALCDLIRSQGAERTVAVASFDQTAMDAFRDACPSVATAATKDEVMRFVGLRTVFLAPLFEPRARVFQVPEVAGGFEVLTEGFAREARRLNMKVEVWTVNETADMQRLLALPVDGIMTDYPDRLLKLLER